MLARHLQARRTKDKMQGWFRAIHCGDDRFAGALGVSGLLTVGGGEFPEPFVNGGIIGRNRVF